MQGWKISKNNFILADIRFSFYFDVSDSDTQYHDDRKANKKKYFL